MRLKKIIGCVVALMGLLLLLLAVGAAINEEIYSALYLGLGGIVCVGTGIALYLNSYKSMKDFFDDLTSHLP